MVMPPRLSLAGESSCQDGQCASQRGRELLSQLAADQGLDCPVSAWSARGNGPVSHPALPAGHYPIMSHRRGLVVAGLANGPVGLDLEVPLPRHRQRLTALVEMLPDTDIRSTILEAPDPQAAFYRAWTLYESLFKLAWLEGQQPSQVLAMRLTSLAPLGEIHCWSSQTPEATLSLCSRHPELEIGWAKWTATNFGLQATSYPAPSNEIG